MPHRLAYAWEWMMCIQSGRIISRLWIDSPIVEMNLEYMALTYSSVRVSLFSIASSRAADNSLRSASRKFSVAPDVQDSWMTGAPVRPYLGPDRRCSRRRVLLVTQRAP